MTSQELPAGDPAKSLALLWGAQDQPIKGSRSGMTVGRIVQEATTLADADGLVALSMRKVAERLEIGTMSLYTYIPGKGELIDLMVDSAASETGRDAQDDLPWRERLEYVAVQNWHLYHRHPWLLEVAINRQPLGPGVVSKYEYEVRTLDGIGLSDVEMDLSLSLVLGHVMSAARASVDVGLALKRTGITDADWWYAHEPFLDKYMRDEDFPTASRVGAAAGQEYQAPFSADHSYNYGLQRILDGIAAHITAV